MTAARRSPRSKPRKLAQPVVPALAPAPGNGAAPQRHADTNTAKKEPHMTASASVSVLGPLNFEGVQTERPVVPAGRVRAQFVGYEVRPTKAGDAHNINPQFKITDEDHPNVGTILYGMWNTKPTALWRMKRDLLALGADQETMGSPNVQITEVLDELKAMAPEVELVVVVEPYTPEGGETRDTNKIERIIAIF